MGRGFRLDLSLRIAPSVVTMAALIAFLGALSGRDLWAPDEPRYGRVASEMLETGDVLVPHWNGRPYAEKPPVAFWLMAASGRIAGGMGPVAARLPCALLAALAVFLLARLARRWFGDSAVGDTAALLFATTGLALWNSSRAALDFPMTACGLAALLAGTRVVAKPSVLAALACGAALGLGVLVKGPHALFLPAAALIGGCALSGNARRLLDWRWGVALAAMVGVVLAWLLPALASADPAWGERLLGQLGSRIAGGEEPHEHGPLLYLWMLPAVALPWTPVWLTSLRHVFPLRRVASEERFGVGAAIAGAAVPLVLLSIPASKRDVYLVPSLAPLAVLAAWALHRIPVRDLKPGVTFVMGLLAVLALAAFAAPFALPSLLPADSYDVVGGATFARGGMAFVLGAIGFSLALGAAAAFLRRHDPAAATRGAAWWFGVAWVVLALGVLPRVDPAKTWTDAVSSARAAAPGVPLATLGFDDAGLVWAARPERVTRLDDVPEERHPPRSQATLLEKAFAPGASPALVILDDKTWREVVALSPSLEAAAQTVWDRRVGGVRYRVIRTGGP